MFACITYMVMYSCILTVVLLNLVTCHYITRSLTDEATAVCFCSLCAFPSLIHLLKRFCSSEKNVIIINMRVCITA